LSLFQSEESRRDRPISELTAVPHRRDPIAAQVAASVVPAKSLFDSPSILVGKDIHNIKVVFNGAGASGIACAEHYVRLGVKRENITLVDTKGVIYEGRWEGMNPYKARFARRTNLRTLAEAVVG